MVQKYCDLSESRLNVHYFQESFISLEEKFSNDFNFQITKLLQLVSRICSAYLHRLSQKHASCASEHLARSSSSLLY